MSEPWIYACTGHRPDKCGGYNTPNPMYLHIVEAIDKALKETKPQVMFSGMALGIDQWVAEACINNDIPFIAAVPFPEQESLWPKKSQIAYKAILAKAFRVDLVSELRPATKKEAGIMLHKRNSYMVDRCHVLLAAWNGTPGGTANCVNDAKFKQKTILEFPIDWDLGHE